MQLGMSYNETVLEVKEDVRLDGGMESQNLDVKGGLGHQKTGLTGEHKRRRYPAVVPSSPRVMMMMI